MRKYYKVHDSDYDVATGAWLESTCCDPDCLFCGERPEKHPEEYDCK